MFLQVLSECSVHLSKRLRLGTGFMKLTLLGQMMKFYDTISALVIFCVYFFSFSAYDLLLLAGVSLKRLGR